MKTLQTRRLSLPTARHWHAFWSVYSDRWLYITQQVGGSAWPSRKFSRLKIASETVLDQKLATALTWTSIVLLSLFTSPILSQSESTLNTQTLAHNHRNKSGSPLKLWHWHRNRQTHTQAGWISQKPSTVPQLWAYLFSSSAMCMFTALLTSSTFFSCLESLVRISRFFCRSAPESPTTGANYTEFILTVN